MLSIRTQRRTSDRRRAGLTLIELVMVLIILVALAGLLVPQVDFLRRSADKATASSDMKSILENVQMYRTLTNSYPDRWDSLLDGSGDWMPGNNGDPTPMPSTGKYTIDTLNANEAASLTNVGIGAVMGHVEPQSAYRGKPGNTGVTAVAVADGVSVATVTDANIIASIYPTGLPAGVKLVALGLGPQNAAIGQTIHSPPAYNAMDAATQYNRYLAVFAVYDSALTVGNFNTRAQLKGVLDSTGDFLNQEIAEFHENNPALTN